ncbi:MAG: AGE family epimerase/isomerase [Planctomycetia bacterium]|nr:AGE family epimerase/isomerase [Planctomycetia bacterium]
MNKDKIEQYRKTYFDGLFCDTLPFWLKNAVDPQLGGIMTCLDREGNVFDTDKGMWQQGRFAWTLGYLYNNFQKNELWLDTCEKTLRFLQSYGFDSDGRMFFQTTRDGRPIRKRRYAFSESFGAISFAQFAQATGSDEARQIALECYKLYDNHVPAPPKYTDERPMIGFGKYAIQIATVQQLRESIGYTQADADIDACIEAIERYFIKPDIRCVMESVAPDGEIVDSCDGRLLNPGHAIEAAWFIMYEGKVRQKPEYVQLGLQMLDWMFERGWDQEYGGLLYFCDVYNKPVVEYWQDMKFWWNHNETIIATLLAYQLTGEEKYAEMHEKIHRWSYAHFPDAQHGDWFGYLHRDGTVATTQKGNMFKGCFHLPRMQWECLRICEELLGASN